MADIVTIGEILVEVMADSVGQKFDETGIFVGPFPSGAPAIFINQASKAGSVGKIISAVGNDGFGKINLDYLKANGTDISEIKVLDDQTTGVAFVTYKEDGDRDFIYHISNAACGDINKDYINEETFNGVSYLHIMGSAIYNDDIRDTILKAIELAKRQGLKISFDPNVRKEIVTDKKKKDLLLEILKSSDIILPGEDELFYLLGIEDESEAVEKLLNEGASIILVKRGKNGATLYTKDIKEDITPIEVEEIDPTGAGDSFGGAFISYLSQGEDVVKAAKIAAIAGAMAVTEKGPMEGSTTKQELEQIYEELY